MFRNTSWWKTALAMLAGAVLTLAVQSIGEKWTRRAEAASISQLAQQTMANLVGSLPIVGGDKIRGVAGLGDGRTFIVYTDTNINFYQFGMATPAPMGR
ncbi:MAG: hypothetical protein N3D11_03355 [Candidatus Sumerlaeia bacterium]|nr:hypothetical protein [Candidatus Sumerlaeia bacterium]